MTYLTYPMHLQASSGPEESPTTTGIRISFDCGYDTMIPKAIMDVPGVHNVLISATCPGCGSRSHVFQVVERFDV